jgi:hypothetical protein
MIISSELSKRNINNGMKYLRITLAIPVLVLGLVLMLIELLTNALIFK